MGRRAKERRNRTTSDRTLEELDGERWGEPNFNSYVVRTCHALRQKPLSTLTDEEVRLAVGQGIGLEWLVPLMLERLAQNPFRAGDFYEGDLLVSLARVPLAFWAAHPEDKAFLANKVLTPALADARQSDLAETTREAIAALRPMAE